ncbi:MAG: hypothetical protein WAN97_06575 [Candidatus Acidiferrales bacterium]
MGGPEIKPEKITHPFQLMAAWFVMLIILVGVLLEGATKISAPKWAAGFLVISSVGLAIMVMAAVFVMLTKFRPHLQGPKEYAEWLKDERKFRGEPVGRIEIGTAPKATRTLPQRRVSDHALPGAVASGLAYSIDVTNLPGAIKVVEALRKLGLQARIYRPEDGVLEVDRSAHAAIWLGSRVPPTLAIPVIKKAVELWPHLRYIHLSTDGDTQPPEEIHDQIYIGGSTATAKRYQLGKWTGGEIQNLPDTLTIGELHALVRAKYPAEDS